MARRVHRQFFPNSKPGQAASQVAPIAKADPVVTAGGVLVEFLVPEHRFTPDEISNLTRWLNRLRTEALNAAAAGLIDADTHYDAAASG